MMRKRMWSAVIGAVIFLNGCSTLEEASTTVTYVKEASGYLQDVTSFVEETPALVQQAASDTEALTQLQTKLEELKKEIAAFDALQVPDIASDLHEQILAKNAEVAADIDAYTTAIQDGKLDALAQENAALVEAMQEITGFMKELQKLAQ